MFVMVVILLGLDAVRLLSSKLADKHSCQYNNRIIIVDLALFEGILCGFISSYLILNSYLLLS
jgi:hypothetical protein